MQCPKCGTVNSESAQFCMECGTAFPKHKSMDFFHPSPSRHCPKCGVSNPKDGNFCFECGTSLERVPQLQSRQCPTCGITLDPSRLFCPNCGQSLIEKPLDAKIDQEPVPSIEKHIECPACGQLTTGDYCRNCGYNLTIRMHKRPIDWWYCDRDSAVMTEINPNLQIPVSRTSLDASLAKAIEQNILQHHDREKARSLALQLFESGGKTNFEVLSQVRCPVCGHQSLAPTTQRPRKVGISYPREIALNVSSILQNGILYFRAYPQLMLIILCAIITDGGLILLGLSAASYYDVNSMLFNLALPSVAMGGAISSLTTLIVIFLVSYVANTFFQCWYYTSLKEIIHDKESPFNIANSFKNSFTFLPRAVAAQFVIMGIILSLVIGMFLVIVVLGVGLSLSNSTSSFFMFLIFVLVAIIAIFGLTVLFMVFFSYVNMSIVFDYNSGVILSLKRSWRFTRRYFWTTVGILIIFYIGSSVLVSFLGTFFSPFYVLLGSSLISTLVYTIFTRLVEAYRSISLGWAYDGFKHTID
ncbi:MAG: zinc ribbon domain-containing protein [Promethearchaeota archaeon]